ncbi:4-hydroxythreonine-4-phosphate dehydrogenase PdxA [Aliikangiella coralliicola]|uniref:4-hydroxythreonine-4-phosphate dehydrogenase PdxA n=1 Tax=Aliikangiella coralliicola TaxID=2592383 RepID=A0A545UE39_9GAMM|nr:4-hydroxythreonine-4-phosphate dehydrogenase PdxA [Aliikangiella coralliicola]TQV87718.1 4-hydroxythreonine-4-phosphate dehydrogenase PdxA [Aliikangiella coralliicola]
MNVNRQSLIPRVALTMGESAGIGPELIVRVAQLKFDAQIVVIADKALLESTAQALNLSLKLINMDWDSPVHKHQPGHLYIENIPCEQPVVAGKLNAENAKATLAILARASELALDKTVDAIVTSPVHKANLNQVDQNFLGHTEFFAKAANIDKVVMMLATDELKVTLATTHLPLAKVPQAITQDELKQVIGVILNSLENITGEKTKVAVCGLNPHAGEGGLLGYEDDEIIRPVIEHFCNQGQLVFGPFPADTLFTPEKRKAYDVFLAMYHDQGLPVIKAFGFGQCVNVTLGLPYIRTSVDHGTALDIAASYTASSDSLEYAVNYALRLLSGRATEQPSTPSS